MRNFMWIFRHYMKKNFLNPTNLLIIGLPLVFSAAFVLLDNFILQETDGMVGGMMYGAVMAMVLAFQFFGADLTANWLHHDIKGVQRARLLVSPIAPRTFYVGVVAAGWLFNVVYGSIVVGITHISFFGTEWGNLGLVLVILLFLSMMSQLVGLMIFYGTKDEKSGARMAYVFGEIMAGVSLLPIIMVNMVENLPGAVVAITNHLPVSAGLNIVNGESIPYNLAVLAGITAVVAAIALLIGRQRNDNL